MHILGEFTPLDPVAGTRPTLRLCSAQDASITGLNGVQWWPGISQMPSLSMPLFDGDFSSSIEPGSATFTAQEQVLEKANANARRMVWAGAGVKLYAGVSGQAWPWTQVFQGIVDSFEREANRLKITAKVDLSPFQANVLVSTYAGTGGAAGGADLKNKPKPLLFGRALNVEPVLIDATNSVFQFSGYGPIQAVNALYERASSFGASVGDFASYALLVAATIPAGRWGTCLAEGMVRLGAPPYGVITGDVDGDKRSGTWIRKTGAIISRACSLAGVSSGVIDAASLTALDTAVARNINVFVSDQITVLDLAQRLARPCNAQAGVSWLGKLFVTRIGIGTPAITLDAQGKRLPAVQKCVESDVSPPYSRMEMGAARAWRVHSLDEIAFAAQLVELGLYSGTTTYREGNIVSLADGSRYLYINPTPTSGNAPPNGTYWSQLNAATRNSVTYSATAPSSPVDGDLWVDTSGTFAVFKLRSGGAWVTGANALTAYNALSGKPVALADINTTESSKLAGIETNADVTLRITGPAKSTVLCDYTGAPKTGQLTKTLTFKLVRGTAETDNTSAATWSCAITNGSGTVANNATKGKVDLSVINTDRIEITVTAVLSGSTRTFVHVVEKDKDDPPVSGGGTGGSGGTTSSDVTIAPASAATYGSPQGGPLGVKAGSAGIVDLSAPLSFFRTTNGVGDAFGKWQWRSLPSGTFADVATEIHAGATSFKNSTDGSNDAGFIGVTMQKTGLTPGADYEFQLLLRNDVAGYTQTFSGTASAVGS